MRLAFLGTPSAAATILEDLLSHGHDIALVITRPDKKRGRGGALVPSAVKEVATRHDLRVAHSLKALDDVPCDLGIVVAYGALISAARLEQLPMVNVHFSLLPRWRGAAPVERAILAGDVETGVCIMGVEATLDTGPVYAQRVTEVAAKTAAELTQELAVLGAEALREVLNRPDPLADPQPQVGESTYAEKVVSSDLALSDELDVATFTRRVRAGKASGIVDGRLLVVVRANASAAVVERGHFSVQHGHLLLGLADGVVELETVRPEGSRSMSGAAWWAGARLSPSVGLRARAVG